MLNRRCIELQEFDKELVPIHDAFEAYSIIKNCKIEDTGDVLLFCSSMNLLNTYVKQKNKIIGYAFKKSMNYLTSLLLNSDIPGIYIDYQEKTSLLVIQVEYIQFSFHFIQKDKDLKALQRTYYHKEIEWDGVRKQQCALTLFELVKQNKFGFSNITHRGKELKKKVAKQLKLFTENKLSFNDF